MTCDCGRPVTDAYACTTCSHRATRALHTIALGLDAELLTTLAKQGTKPERTGAKPAKASEAPLPIDLRASEARHILRNTLTTWVRLAHDDGHGADLPEDTITAMARWLLPAVEWLRHRDYASQVFDEIAAAAANALAVINIPMRRVYVCQCTCGEHVYGREDIPAATCPDPDCGTVWGVKEQREWMRERADGHLFTAADMARAVSRPGDPVLASTIRTWATRGRLVSHGKDSKGHAMYLVGDVLDLVAERAAWREQRVAS